MIFFKTDYIPKKDGSNTKLPSLVGPTAAWRTSTSHIPSAITRSCPSRFATGPTGPAVSAGPTAYSAYRPSRNSEAIFGSPMAPSITMSTQALILSKQISRIPAQHMEYFLAPLDKPSKQVTPAAWIAETFWNRKPQNPQFYSKGYCMPICFPKHFDGSITFCLGAHDRVPVCTPTFATACLWRFPIRNGILQLPSCKLTKTWRKHHL